MKGSNTPPLYPREWQLRPYNGQYNAQFVIHSNSTEIGAMETDGAIGPDNTWSYVSGTYDGAHDYVFLNGTVRGSNVCTTVIHDTAAPLTIGRLGSISAEYYYGTIDEVRISNTNRSSDWIWAEWMNMTSNNTFNIYGTITTNAAVNSYAVAAEKTQSWTLEPAGNWAQFKDGTNTENRTHNLFNEITAINSNSLAVVHDRAGNMTRFPSALDSSNVLFATWDVWNRLTSVTSATSAVTFSYDGDWKRLKKTVGSAVTEYYYDDMQLAEIRTNGVAREQFVYDSRYLHSVAVRDVLASDASLLTRHFLVNDANFNVTALVSTNGAVVERYTYDPYGKVSIRDSSWQPITWDASQQNIILYTGHKYDAESGLYYSLYRYYHPGLGRWASRDPLLEVYGQQSNRGKWRLDMFRQLNDVCTDDVHLGVRAYHLLSSAPVSTVDDKGLLGISSTPFRVTLNVQNNGRTSGRRRSGRTYYPIDLNGEFFVDASGPDLKMYVTLERARDNAFRDFWNEVIYYSFGPYYTGRTTPPTSGGWSFPTFASALSRGGRASPSPSGYGNDENDTAVLRITLTDIVSPPIDIWTSAWFPIPAGGGGVSHKAQSGYLYVKGCSVGNAKIQVFYACANNQIMGLKG